MKFSKLA